MPQKPAKGEVTVAGETFYSAVRAAKMMGVHYRTVMRHIKIGGLRAAKVGMFTYISATELRRFLTEGSTPGAATPATPPPAPAVPIREAMEGARADVEAARKTPAEKTDGNTPSLRSRGRAGGKAHGGQK